jgi:hypothetical protein
MALLVYASDGQGVAVAAWVGAGHPRPGLGIARNPLAATDDPGPVVEHVDGVPALA